MGGRILVLGATGRLGYAAAEAFRDASWSVASLVRPGAGSRAPGGTEIVEANVVDRNAVTDAARGADVVLHALNPVYTEWAKFALPLTYIAIEAAEAVGATLMFPGNVYNLGPECPRCSTRRRQCSRPRARGNCAKRSSSACGKPPSAAYGRSSCAPATSMGADTDRGSISSSRATCVTGASRIRGRST